MAQSDRDFKILNSLAVKQVTSQRQISELTGISLGQVNYALKSLFKRGLVKIGNFSKNPRKIGYIYLLTPKGIETKSKLAFHFVMARLSEYEKLRHELTLRLNHIKTKGLVRAAMIGPDPVCDLVRSVIEQNRLNLSLVCQYNDIKKLRTFGPDAFDLVIVFDGNSSDELKKIEIEGISQDKIVRLW